MSNQDDINNLISKFKDLGMTISTAESLTAGMVSADIASGSGASKVLKGGVIAYFLEVKENILDIPKEIIGKDAVNQETAILMAKNVAIKLNSDIGVSTTGIAEMYDEREPQAYVSIYDKKNDKSHDFYLKFNKEMSRQSVREKISKILIKKLLYIDFS